MLLSLLLGGFFVLTGRLMRPGSWPDDVRTVGTVARVWRGHAFGEQAWLYEVESRDLGGRAYRLSPAVVGGRAQPLGGPVQVLYRPHDPAGTARRTDGVDGWMHRVPVGAGAALLAASALTGLP